MVNRQDFEAREMTAMSLGTVSQAIRCTFPSCKCECFTSSKSQIRTCQNCKHGWVAHALDKLISNTMYPGMTPQAEPISPSKVFDIASLVLYDCQAIPIRIKFSLDRLFSGLQHDEVLQILHAFGWSYEDYARGYILQDPTGRVLEKWSIILREEETIVLQQFLRFAETRNIAQELIVQDTKSLQDIAGNNNTNAKSDSDIRKFIERNNMALIQSYNLALRRAFDNPQSLFSAMGAFPGAHLNLAAAAAASQFGRGFPPSTGMMTMPTAGFPQSVTAKAEPITTAEQINNNLKRKLSEPYDLSNKRSPESHKSCSPALSTSGPAHNHNSTPASTPTHDRSALDLGAPGMRKSPMPNLVRRPPSPSTSSNKGWPFNNPSFGQTVYVSSSGKKRVLCTACNKTFCDKGALKIHYSAVHLKEMHQCTIPGCNMMFSSRRSRNRHSANPNPKLHTPQTRRPRERFDGSQDMMAIMGVPHSAKSAEDDGSSGEDNTQDKQKSYKSVHDSGDEQSGDYIDDDLDDELPTQLKQESPIYGSSKRKRLMPTRVPATSEPDVMEEDNKSDADKSVTSEPHSMDESLDVENSNDGLNQNVYMREDGEPGEVRRSPAEPGEVIRGKSSPEKKFNSPEKQTTNMHSLFSSFLPPTEHPVSDFWSNFIQQTAAAQKAVQRHADASSQEEDEEDDEVYRCNNCEASFSTRQKHDAHMLTHNRSKTDQPHQKSTNMDTESNDEASTQLDCRFCEKSFQAAELLERHVDTVHHGQESLYPDQSYSNHIDSIKNKTPVIA